MNINTTQRNFRPINHSAVKSTALKPAASENLGAVDGFVQSQERSASGLTDLLEAAVVLGGGIGGGKIGSNLAKAAGFGPFVSGVGGIVGFVAGFAATVSIVDT